MGDKDLQEWCEQLSQELADGRGLVRSKSRSSVDFVSVSNFDHKHNEFTVIHAVHDPVYALPNPIPGSLPGELFTAAWTRVISKGSNPIHHLTADLFRLDPLNLFGRRSLDANAISGHGV